MTRDELLQLPPMITVPVAGQILRTLASPGTRRLRLRQPTPSPAIVVNRWLGRAEVEATQELGVEGDHDGRGAHQDGADGWGQGEAGPGEHAGGQGDGDQVVAGGPAQVLEHLAVAGLRQPQGPED